MSTVSVKNSEASKISRRAIVLKYSSGGIVVVNFLTCNSSIDLSSVTVSILTHSNGFQKFGKSGFTSNWVKSIWQLPVTPGFFR